MLEDWRQFVAPSPLEQLRAGGWACAAAPSSLAQVPWEQAVAVVSSWAVPAPADALGDVDIARRLLADFPPEEARAQSPASVVHSVDDVLNVSCDDDGAMGEGEAEDEHGTGPASSLEQDGCAGIDDPQSQAVDGPAGRALGDPIGTDDEDWAFGISDEAAVDLAAHARARWTFVRGQCSARDHSAAVAIKMDAAAKCSVDRSTYKHEVLPRICAPLLASIRRRIKADKASCSRDISNAVAEALKLAGSWTHPGSLWQQSMDLDLDGTAELRAGVERRLSALEPD